MNTEFIDATSNQNNADFDFGGEMTEWIERTNLDHVILCLHEGSHVLWRRELGFEPQMYGPSDELRFYPGIGWRSTLGSVQGLPITIQLRGNALLIAKSLLGARYVEERLLGQQMTDEIWEGAVGDLDIYNKWRAIRQAVVGDVGSLCAEDVRKSVFKDFERPEFLKLLIQTGREYERRVSELPEQK